MIDTNRLIAMREIETNLRAEGQSSRADCFLELSDEIARLRAELAECRKDAEMYKAALKLCVEHFDRELADDPTLAESDFELAYKAAMEVTK